MQTQRQCKNFVFQCLKIQRIMKDVLSTRYSKVDLLSVLWDKTLGRLMMKAGLLKEKKILAMCRQIVTVTRAQRHYILKKFIQACRLMHTVAFMQWRLAFPNSVRHDKDEVVDLLDEAYNRLYSKPLVFALSPKTK